MQLVFWSTEGIRFISPSHVTFCSFWIWLGYLLQFMFFLSLIYLLIVIRDSFTLGRLFDFIFAHSWLNGALYFSLKNLSWGNFFKLIYINMKVVHLLFLTKLYNTYICWISYLITMLCRNNWLNSSLLPTTKCFFFDCKPTESTNFLYIQGWNLGMKDCGVSTSLN